ncbi:MAG: hypothetical protein IK064_01390 [Clostridia bacterium]|nr:hypothetical protein [Clostridia bacterium]MBR6006261.1 hypothetical protein [Clostridia bacterium]
MKVINWLKAKKQRSKAQRQEKLAIERGIVLNEPQPFNAEAAGIVPPETRFTEEYQEFLKQQEAAAEKTEILRDDN